MNESENKGEYSVSLVGPDAGAISVIPVTVTDEGRGPGRPTKQNEQTIATVCEAIADGLPIKSACAVAGIGVETLSRWRKENPELQARIEAAKVTLQQKAFRAIGNAIKDGDWRAAVEALKLAFPEYRQTTKVEVNATATANSATVICTEEQRAELIAQREKLLRECPFPKSVSTEPQLQSTSEEI